ncbi:MAG: hypothetical protein LBR87_09580, partial [Synergistaceae bacterium]|nr:hypothetical protein [Synergistaceae bacterium]
MRKSGIGVMMVFVLAMMAAFGNAQSACASDAADAVKGIIDSWYSAHDNAADTTAISVTKNDSEK